MKRLLEEYTKQKLYKTAFRSRNDFEDMGLTYLGPVDGHNIERLVKTINMAKKVNHAVVIHVHTTKGKGYPFAERKPSFFHGVDPFDIETGKPVSREK